VFVYSEYRGSNVLHRTLLPYIYRVKFEISV
jgi:hypothetical protein